MRVLNLSLRFKDKSIEKSYQKQLRVQSTRYTRVEFFLAMAILLIFFIKDVISYSPAIIIENIVIYSFPLCIIIIGIITTFCAASVMYSGYIFLLSLIASISTLFLLIIRKPDTTPFAYMVVILVLIVLGFVTIVPYIYLAVTGPIIIIIYCAIAVLRTGIHPVTLYRHIFFMLLFQMIVLVARYKYESLARKNFLQSYLKGQYEVKTFSRYHDLSDREKEVMMLLLEGMQGPKIGEALEISAETVKKHTQKIFAKTGVHSRLELFSRFESFFTELD